MIGIRIRRPYHDRREPLVAIAEPEGPVARHELVSRPHRRLDSLTAPHRQRLEIGLVGEEDAGILGAEGMPGIRSHRETEPRQSRSRRPEIGHGNDEMVERANCCHGRPFA